MESPIREKHILGDFALKKKRRNLGLFVFLSLLCGRFLAAETGATLLGLVRDEGNKPLENVLVSVISADGSPSETTRSDRDGFFGLSGLAAGEFALSLEKEGFTPITKEGLIFEPSMVLCLKAALVRAGSESGTPPRVVIIDLSDISAQTLISAFQVEALPSANNFWSLVENQDLSATTNRIDVGGMWSDVPALLSSRGSSSWTQTTYLLNGLDVTDPYWRGQPLFYPDLSSLENFGHSTGRHPVSYLSPGGYLNLTPKKGSPEYHGAFSGYLSEPWMTTSNISPSLKSEGLEESHRLHSLQNVRAQLAGPILRDRLSFYTSLQALHLNRDIAEFEDANTATVFTGLLNLGYRLSSSTLEFLWTGQVVRQPTYGAGRKVPFSSTLDQKNLYQVLQVIWNKRFRPGHSLRVGASFSYGNTSSNFQVDALGPHGEDIFTKVPSGAAAEAGRDNRNLFVLQADGDMLLGSLARFHHRVAYGLSLQYAGSSAEKEILDDIHLRFYDGAPVEVVRFDSPFRHSEKALHFDAYAQETLTFPNLASLSFGLHCVSSRGWVPGVGSGRINWLNFSPRLGLALPLARDKSLILRFSAARTYFHLPLSYLTFGNPGSLAGLVYAWTDVNHDLEFQPGEEGLLRRREGSLFAQIDPELKRPYADDYALSLTQVYKNGLTLTLAGFYREARHLVETLNVGVPLSAYDSVPFYDPGDDRIPGTHDDLDLTVYNQKTATLGQDFFLLTNPGGDGRVSRYRGLDLTLLKRFSRRTVFFLSLTATEAVGTTSPGNTEWENDDGVIGSLYDNPNASIFARGRLRFDRAYTGRLGLSVAIPFGFRLAGLVKYYDGQPFARKIVVSGLNQGLFYIQASPRGKTRYEFNLTVDLRLEKSFPLGKARARLILDGYNIFNSALATEENEWTGPQWALRFATEVQSPRVFRIGFSYEF